MTNSPCISIVIPSYNQLKIHIWIKYKAYFICCTNVIIVCWAFWWKSMHKASMQLSLAAGRSIIGRRWVQVRYSLASQLARHVIRIYVNSFCLHHQHKICSVFKMTKWAYFLSTPHKCWYERSTSFLKLT